MEVHDFSQEDTEVHFLNSSIYQLRTICGVAALAVHATNCLLGKDVDVNKIPPSLLSITCFNSNKQYKIPTLCTQTKNTFVLDEMLLQILRPGDLHILVWLSTALHLSACILFSFAFFNLSYGWHVSVETRSTFLACQAFCNN